MVEATKLQEVAAELDRRFGLEVLYLYGSQATGRDRAGSDVDLGALFRRSPSPAELFDAGGVLATLLGRDGLRRMAGFRNIAVHEYRKLDRDILDRIVAHRLDDLRVLGRRIVERFLSATPAH
jgi:predicted nucleotidyltransferase